MNKEERIEMEKEVEMFKSCIKAMNEIHSIWNEYLEYVHRPLWKRIFDRKPRFFDLRDDMLNILMKNFGVKNHYS